MAFLATSISSLLSRSIIQISGWLLGVPEEKRWKSILACFLSNWKAEWSNKKSEVIWVTKFPSRLTTQSCLLKPILGSRTAAICEVCFWRSVIFHPMPWLLLVTPFIVIITQSINYVHPIGRILVFTLVMYAIYFIFSTDSKYYLLEFWHGAGSRQAIKVYKQILTRGGYNQFWTPGVYEKFTTRK